MNDILMAIKDNNIESIKDYLLNEENRKNLNSIKSYENKPLIFDIIEYSNREILNLFIENGLKYENVLYKNFDPIGYAIYKKKYDIIEYFVLDKKIELNKGNTAGRTPLIYAADSGDIKIIELLLKNGALVNYPGKNKETPLMWAGYRGHLEAVKFLVENGANIEDCGGYSNWTPICWAIRTRECKVIDYLLDKGAYLPDKLKKFINSDYYRYELTDKFDYDLINLFLDYCDEKKTSRDLYSLYNDISYHLENCIVKNDVNLFREIINNFNFDINYKNQWEETILYSAIKHNRMPFIRYLVEIKDADIKNVSKKNALFVSLEYENLEAIDYFINRGLNINEKDDEGNNCLSYCIKYNKLKSLNHLLNNYLSVINPEFFKDSKLLLKSIYKQNNELFTLLLKYNDINKLYENNLTLFLITVKNMEFEIANKLLEYGADIYKGDISQMFEEDKNIEILDYLLEKFYFIDNPEIYLIEKIINSLISKEKIEDLMYLIKNVKNNTEIINIINKILEGIINNSFNDEKYKEKLILSQNYNYLENDVLRIVFNIYDEDKYRDFEELLVRFAEKDDKENEEDYPDYGYDEYKDMKEDLINTMKEIYKPNAFYLQIAYLTKNDKILDKYFELKFLPVELMNLAIRMKDIEMINLLIEKGININKADLNGKYPIMYVIESGDCEFLKYFLKFNPDLYVMDHEHETIFNYLQKSQNIDLAGIILEYIVNIKDKEYKDRMIKRMLF